MVAGVLTLTGRPAPRNVVAEFRSELVPAQTQHQNMAEKIVLEILKKEENVTRTPAKVCRNYEMLKT